MRYAVSRFDEFDRDMAYRFYITNSIQMYSQGKAYTKSFYEFLNDKKRPTDTRTGDEIAADIIKRAGLSFG